MALSTCSVTWWLNSISIFDIIPTQRTCYFVSQGEAADVLISNQECSLACEISNPPINIKSFLPYLP